MRRGCLAEGIESRRAQRPSNAPPTVPDFASATHGDMARVEPRIRLTSPARLTTAKDAALKVWIGMRVPKAEAQPDLARRSTTATRLPMLRWEAMRLRGSIRHLCRMVQRPLLGPPVLHLFGNGVTRRGRCLVSAGSPVWMGMRGGGHRVRRADVRAVPRDHRTQPACPGFPTPPTPRIHTRPGPFPRRRHRRRPMADAVGSSTSPCGRCLPDPMPTHGKTGPFDASHGQCSRIEFPPPKPIETTPCQCSRQHRPAVPFRHLRAPPPPLAEQHTRRHGACWHGGNHVEARRD